MNENVNRRTYVPSTWIVENASYEGRGDETKVQNPSQFQLSSSRYLVERRTILILIGRLSKTRGFAGGCRIIVRSACGCVCFGVVVTEQSIQSAVG